MRKQGPDGRITARDTLGSLNFLIPSVPLPQVSFIVHQFWQPKDMNVSDCLLKIGEASFRWEDESPMRKRNRLAQREYRKSASF